MSQIVEGHNITVPWKSGEQRGFTYRFPKKKWGPTPAIKSKFEDINYQTILHLPWSTTMQGLLHGRDFFATGNLDGGKTAQN